MKRLLWAIGQTLMFVSKAILAGIVIVGIPLLIVVLCSTKEIAAIIILLYFGIGIISQYESQDNPYR